MKTRALAFALIVSFFVATAPALFADGVLTPLKDVVLAGNIMTNPATLNGKIVSIPLTKANLLGLFKITGVSPGKTAFFVDLSPGTIILASKDGKTIYGALLAPKFNDSYAYLSGQSGARQVALTPASVVGSIFTGTVLIHSFSPMSGKPQNGSTEYVFTAYGTIDDASSPDAIISGTLRCRLGSPASQP